MNEDFFFINQKVVASKINETINNIDNSLVYKLDLSSTVSYLSPLVDLSRASVKTITNRVENPQGKESRFGRRDQILSFFPVFSMTVAGVDPSEVISLDQRVTGGTTKAEGIVCLLYTSPSPRDSRKSRMPSSA